MCQNTAERIAETQSAIACRKARIHLQRINKNGWTSDQSLKIGRRQPHDLSDHVSGSGLGRIDDDNRQAATANKDLACSAEVARTVGKTKDPTVDRISGKVNGAKITDVIFDLYRVVLTRASKDSPEEVFTYWGDDLTGSVGTFCSLVASSEAQDVFVLSRNERCNSNFDGVVTPGVQPSALEMARAVAVHQPTCFECDKAAYDRQIDRGKKLLCDSGVDRRQCN